MPHGDPDASVVLRAEITDTDGLGDVTNVSVCELLNGFIQGDSAQVPAYFYYSPADDGTGVDQAAGDGIYSSEGRPGGLVDAMSEVTIRVSAKDVAKTVTVADTVLPIGN
jgi:hypothetical protein